MSYDDWWSDRQTRQLRAEIDSLASYQAAQNARARRERQREQRRTASLETRLDRLEAGVRAVVELEGLREVLHGFADAAATRAYARDVLARIPSLGKTAVTAAPVLPADVPGYWLHPAIRWVEQAVAAQAGGAPAEEDLADEARRRDRSRSAQFFALVCVAMATEVSDVDLSVLWPQDRRVSPTQRTLWVAAAEGALGENARSFLVASLRQALRTPIVEDAAATDGGRRALAMPDQHALETAVTTGLLGGRIPNDPERALHALAEVRRIVEDTAAGTRPEPAAAGVLPELSDLLAQVVTSGAPAEAPVVQRIMRAQAAIATIGADAEITTPMLLDEHELDMLELLTSDLDTGTRPGVRSVAVDVLAPTVRDMVLAVRDATRRPVQLTERVRVAGVGNVEVGVAGPTEAGWEARISASVAALNEADPRRARSRAIVLAAVTAAMLAFGILWAPALVGAGVAALGAAIYARRWRSSEAEAISRSHATIARLKEDLQSAQHRMQGRHQEVERSREGVEAEVLAIGAALERPLDAAPEAHGISQAGATPSQVDTADPPGGPAAPGADEDPWDGERTTALARRDAPRP